MFKLALKGLTGRKKSMFLVFSVIFMSFFLSVLAVNLYSNSEKIKTFKREQIYGKWKTAAFGIKNGSEPFSVDESTVIKGKNRIIGLIPGFGNLESFDEGFLKLSNINMIEGRMPEGIDEVAIEQNQKGNFEQVPKIGDSIISDVEIFAVDREADNDPDKLKDDMKLIAAENAIANLDAESQKFIYDIYGSEFNLTESDKLKNDLKNLISVRLGNRNNKRGLENNGDTIIIPAEEFIQFSYSFDLTRLIDKAVPKEDHDKRIRLFETALGLAQKAHDSGNPENSFVFTGESSIIYKRSYIFRRTLKVTGFYNSISNTWNGKREKLPNSLVTEKTAENFIENGIAQKQEAAEKYTGENNFYVSADINNAGIKNGKYYLNSLAYPPGYSTDTLLVYTFLVFIFIMTLFGILQLYMNQLGERLKKFALLRSVGASKRQVTSIVIIELIILAAISLPAALLLGNLAAQRISQKLSTGFDLFRYKTDLPLTLSAIGLSLTALCAAIFYPLGKIRGIPLTGKITSSKSESSVKIKNSIREKNSGMTSLKDILKQHMKFSSRERLITRLVYTVIISTIILGTLLTFFAFNEYKNKVTAVNMPDYDIRFEFALNDKETKAITEELKKAEPEMSIQKITGRKKGQLTSDSVSDPLYKDTSERIPESLRNELFVSAKDASQYPDSFRPGSRKVSLYAISPDSEAFRSLNDSLNGLLNTPSFTSGNGIVLLYPSFIKNNINPPAIQGLQGVSDERISGTVLSIGGLYDLSYDFRDSGIFNKITSGDSSAITLTFNSEVNNEIDRNISPPSEVPLKVLAAVSSLPEFGIWPFSSTLENPVIIGSDALVRSLIQFRVTGSRLIGISASETLVPTLYGNDRISIWLNSEDTPEKTIAIQNIAARYGGQTENLHKDKIFFFNSALSISVVIITASLLISLIALQIQLNISRTRSEKEKYYIGSLQSLGVNYRELKKILLNQGLKTSVTAVFFAHILFVAAIIIRVLVKYPFDLLKSHFLRLIYSEMWLYPWIDHIILTLLFIAVGTLIWYSPYKDLLKRNPISNIRMNE